MVSTSVKGWNQWDKNDQLFCQAKAPPLCQDQTFQLIRVYLSTYEHLTFPPSSIDNTEIIINSVISLFICDVDEFLCGILRVCSCRWVKSVSLDSYLFNQDDGNSSPVCWGQCKVGWWIWNSYRGGGLNAQEAIAESWLRLWFLWLVHKSQIHKRLFSISAKEFFLLSRFMCICLVQKVIFLENT